MAWFAIEEGGKLIAYAEGKRGAEPGGYDDPRFTLTKLSRRPDIDDEFVDGSIRKRADASQRRAARAALARPQHDRIAELEASVANLKEQVAALMGAKPA